MITDYYYLKCMHAMPTLFQQNFRIGISVFVICLPVSASKVHETILVQRYSNYSYNIATAYMFCNVHHFNTYSFGRLLR